MDEGTMTAATACAPSWWRLRDMQAQLRGWFVQRLLGLVVRLMDGDSNLMAHARRELPPDGGDEMQRDMNQCLLQLLAVFAAQGHSGFSASYATATVEKLMRFQPLGPLTGGDEEWFDHGGGMFQNKRCSHVFKDRDRFGGQAYDINGRIFREPGGVCYTGSGSCVPITFPYTPKSEYVDVPASAD